MLVVRVVLYLGVREVKPDKASESMDRLRSVRTSLLIVFVQNLVRRFQLDWGNGA